MVINPPASSTRPGRIPSSSRRRCDFRRLLGRGFFASTLLLSLEPAGNSREQESLTSQGGREATREAPLRSAVEWCRVRFLNGLGQGRKLSQEVVDKLVGRP